jgi:hypothetical protein
VNIANKDRPRSTIKRQTKPIIENNASLVYTMVKDMAYLVGIKQDTVLNMNVISVDSKDYQNNIMYTI